MGSYSGQAVIDLGTPQICWSIPVIVETVPPPRQVRFPRSKKRRIQKKWHKNRRNWTDPQPLCKPGEVYMIGESMMLADAATVARIGEAAKLDVDLTGSDHSTEPIATTGDILADVKAVVDRLGPRRRSPLEFDIVQPPIIWSPLRLRKDLEQMRDRMVREDRRRCFPPC